MAPKKRIKKKRVALLGGSELLPFALSLFLAFGIWTIHKLSANYNFLFQYRVNLNHAVSGREGGAESLNKLSIRGRATGFYILQSRFKGGELTLSPQPYQLKEVEGSENRFYLLTSDIKDDIIESFKGKVIADYIIADTLFFNLPKVEGRELPVVIKANLKFKDQYMATGDFRLQPNLVTISGERELIEKIDTLYTNPINIQNIERSLSGVAKLKPIKGVTFLESEIYYTLEVVRYFEERRVVPVKLSNIPEGVTVEIEPQEVEVLVRRAIREATLEELNSLSINLNYQQLSNNGEARKGVVAALLSSTPKEILHYRVEPPYLKYKVIRGD